MTRRVVLGVRVSEDDKNQDPENQLLPLRAAMARLGWSVVTEVRIEGLSAWNAKTATEVKRQFLAPILTGQADTLAVWCLDRVVRGGIEPTLAFLRELEQHHGAHLYSQQEPWASSATQDKAVRELIVSLMAWVAQQESARKSERVKAKVDTKRNRAEAVGQKANWGLGKLASEMEVWDVWRLSSEGSSVRAIAKETGIPKSTVGRILARPKPPFADMPALREKLQGIVPREPLGHAGADTDGGAPSQGGPLGQESDGSGAAGGPA